MREVRLFCDGACQPNPGAMAIGVVLVDEGDGLIDSISRACGDGTNNIAEQLAALGALELARRHRIIRPSIFTDSRLVVEQTNGRWSVSDHLRERADQIRQELRALSGTIQWVPREQNELADRLSKAGLGYTTPVAPPDRDQLLLQLKRGLSHAATQNDRVLSDFLSAIMSDFDRNPVAAQHSLLTAKLGRSSHSNHSYELAAHYARIAYGAADIRALEESINDRTEATRLRGMRFVARGLPPLLVQWKLALEKHETAKWRKE